MDNKEFDLAVIGSGPGGMHAAIQAAKAGKKVVVVDKNDAGGGCVFFGTVPSKSLREASLQPGGFHDHMERMRKVVEAESRVIFHQLTRNGVIFLRGTASFLSPHLLEVFSREGSVRVHAQHFVIATGTSPRNVPEFPVGSGPIYDSDTILALETLPSRLLVVGAGVIGCEYASIFTELGANVTLVDRRHELLRGVDPEAVEALRVKFEAKGISVHLGAGLGTLRKETMGTAKLSLMMSNKTWSGDAALICLGRVPNTKDLGLERIGVECDTRGVVMVDSESYRTSLSHICAVGDVIGPPSLAATSAEQGRIAASRMFAIPSDSIPATVPSGIYTIPEISSVGQCEPELQEMRVPYVVGRASYRELARGLIAGEETGFVKLLVHRETRQLLGVHAFGHGASELIHIGQLARALQAPVEFLVGNVFNYPTFAEAYKVAALNALNQLRKN